MKWFEGGIPEAIQKAKTTRSLFVVYIYGTDELSKQQDETWQDPAVEAAFQHAGCVAISLKANSDSCAQFSQIYPVVCVPCTYLIGETGAPLEVTAGNVTPDQLIEKLDNIMQSRKSAEACAPEPAPQASPEPGASSSPESTRQLSQQEQLDIEEKKARALDTMNRLREEKAEQEKQKEKQKEIERREQGKNLGQLRNWQKDQEAKEVRDQIKKDKEEAKLARQRVKDQIARDREERAEKYKQEKVETERQKQEKLDAKLTSQKEAAEKDALVKRENARIQFRLPDGSALTETFPSSQTLDCARQFVREKAGNKLGGFSFCMTYPRRNFTDEDMSQTFLDLDLAPSAVIVVLPGSRFSSSSSGDSGGGTTLIMMLLAPVLALWTFFMTFLFGAPQNQRGVTSPPPADSPRSTEPQAQSSPSDSAESPQSSSARGKNRPKSSYGLRSRQEGNIHRLSADDDDDMATWNGNSTQQM